jgi:hypothetical protein
MKVQLGPLALVIDIADEIADALDKDGPGGRKVTVHEAVNIGEAVTRALLEMAPIVKRAAKRRAGA